MAVKNHKSARMIQARWRGYNLRVYRNVSAVLIQKEWRRVAAHSKYILAVR